jgi:aspartate racemase
MNISKKLGIIGGMGPQATAYFFDRIVDHTQASKDQEHIDIVIFNHATMPDRTQAILTGEHALVVDKLVEDVQSMEKLGVENIAIPCNTSHYFYDSIQEKTNIPIINMVKETVAYIIQNSNKINKIGIMATDGTIRTKTYENECSERGVEAILPSQEKQKIVMSIIYDEIKNGKRGSMDKFMEVIDELRGNGCDAIILACTELSYFKQYYTLPDYCVDSMDVLVRKSIEVSGKNYKD